MPEYPPEVTYPSAPAASTPRAAAVAAPADEYANDLVHLLAGTQGGAADARIPLSHAKACCKATNACKGQGNCKTAKNLCKGQNDCKGQGGCKPIKCP
jgi:hypothetical protein